MDQITLPFVGLKNSKSDEAIPSWYGVEFDTAISAPTCTRIGDLDLHRTLPIHNRMKGCLLNDAGEVVKYLAPNDWTAEVRDGSLGQVMIELPEHYRRFETDGTKRRVMISTYPIPGYHLVRKRYVSAYEATIKRSDTTLCSVVNMDADYRGGAPSGTDNPYLLGCPATGLSRTEFRNYARKRKAGSAEWNCLTYDICKELYWLFVIEYATLNSQTAFNAKKDSDGYAQGGLGDGVSNFDRSLTRPCIPCGYTDSIGNGSGELPCVVRDNEGSTFATTMVPRYRGIENPFGHILKWIDGINVSADQKVFVCADPSKFSDDEYDDYFYVGNIPLKDGYIKELIFGEDGEIIPSVVGGSSTTYFCDYLLVDISMSETIIPVKYGGNMIQNARCGLVQIGIYSEISNVCGSRLCFIPKI